MTQNPPLFSLFRPFANLEVLLSEKNDNGMKVRYELDRDDEALQNRKQFFVSHGIPEAQVVVAQLVHGDTVKIVSQQDAGKYIPDTDGLLTRQKNLFLSITVADCLPIYIYDPEKEIVGLLHAGWRGLDKKIISHAIDILGQVYKVTKEKLLIGIGPGIGPCHFAVKEDVLEKFVDYSHVSIERNNEYFLDLKQIAKQQCIQSGVRDRNIEINSLCTYCEKDRYFSYRRDGSFPHQVMVASIGMR